MTGFEVMRRLVFLLISVWSVLGVQTMTGATDCAKDLDSSELGELSFLEETANLVYSTECETRVLQCRSIYFCSIQWFFNDIPYDSWSWGDNSDTKYQLEDSNQTLKFLSTDVDAGGNYTCVASNGVRNITRRINMIVKERIWLNKPIPYQSSSVVCKDQMAVLGGNASFFCQFKYGNSGVLPPQRSWRKLNQTSGLFRLVDCYEISGTEFSHGSRTEDENSTQTQNCPEKPTTILSTWLNITNVTEEALGMYQVDCKISGYLTKVNLTLSLATTGEPAVKVTDTTSVVVVVMTMIILLSLFGLSWKRYGTDVKLWYHDHRATLETEEIDNKLYDAYIISCYEGQDKSFVDNILCPSLKDQYKLFIRERDATFGSVESEEIVEALTKSRRCIVVLSADFYRHPLTSSPQSGRIETTAVQLTSSTSLSSSPSSSSFSGNDLSENEWHLFELHHALDIMHPNVIPLLYRDSGPTSLSNTDSNAKLIDHVLNDVTCLKWKQKHETCLDDWAMKRLRLRLPPRRRGSYLPSGQSSYIRMPVMSATTPSNISSSKSLTSPSSLTTERPFAVQSSLHHLSGPESSRSDNLVVGEASGSSQQNRRSSQSSQISFTSTTTSPLSLTAPMSLSSSLGSSSIPSPDSQRTSQPKSSPYTSSSLFSPSPPVHANEPNNLNSFQEYQPNSNTINSSLSIFQYFLGPKKEPHLIDNECNPGYI